MATLGPTSPGTSSVPNVLDRAWGNKHTFPSAGTLTKITAFFDFDAGNSSTACNAKAVVYADNAGSPGALVAVSGATAVGANDQTVDFTLSASVSASAYWFFIVTDDGPGSNRSNQVDFSSGTYCRVEGLTYTSPGDPCPAPAAGPTSSSNLYGIYATYTTNATLSAPTASGVTATTATLGATTDQTSGTFYVVVDTAANLSGVTASQIKAGQKASGSAALASGNAAVSTTTPSVGVTGLSQSTLYSYAAVQNNSNGDSNVLTGTFTTSDPALDQSHFRWRNDDGSETTATWAAAEDANVTIAALTPTRLRVEIAATANPASAAYKLQYRKVGDTYWRDAN